MKDYTQGNLKFNFPVILKKIVSAYMENTLKGKKVLKFRIFELIR